MNLLGPRLPTIAARCTTVPSLFNVGGFTSTIRVGLTDSMKHRPFRAPCFAPLCAFLRRPWALSRIFATELHIGGSMAFRHFDNCLFNAQFPSGGCVDLQKVFDLRTLLSDCGDRSTE